MKQAGIVIGILFGVGVLVIVVLPFFLGYSPGAGTSVTPPSQEQPTNRPKSDVGIFKSVNSGANWDEKNTSTGGDISKVDIIDFAIHPFSSSLIFAGTKGAGLWRSDDNGNSWTKIADKNSVLKPTASVYRVIFNKNNPQELYLAVFQDNRGRLLHSTDRGDSFKEVYQTPLDRYGVFDGFVDQAGTVYIVTGQGGFFASADSGASWRIVRWFKDGIIRLVVDPRNDSHLYAFTEKGSIFKSDSKGALWVDITNTLSQFSGADSSQSMIIDLFDSTLYLASEYGLLTSADGGLHWSATSLIIPPEALPILAVARDPFDQNTLYVSASTQLYRSTDRGVNWSIIPSPTGNRIIDLKPDPQQRGVYFSVISR